LCLIWRLEGRTHVGGTILYGEEHVEKYTKFFERLFQAAVEYNKDRIILVKLGKETRDAISKWPHYRAPYGEMDYAIHSLDEAWLRNFGLKPKSKSFAAYDDGDLIGFSILDLDEAGGAELYVAIHPNKVNNGYGTKKYGTTLVRMTIRKGFDECERTRVHIRVRNNLQHRITMYEKIGFVKTGNKTEVVDGKQTEFIEMDMTKERYKSHML
jgi:RimJ/RimL family protein N-acetyltransferase